jgi:acyl-CoA synthetase (AMP-forming)/AMP-acid ligase II/acyl carrier protein
MVIEVSNTFDYMEKLRYIQQYQNLVEMLDDRASNYQDKTAFIELEYTGQESSRITYGKLISRAILLAKEIIRTSGDGKNCLITIPPGIDFILAFLGCIYAGKVAVPVHPPRAGKKNNRFWSIVDNAKPSIVLLNESSTSEIDKIAVQDNREIKAHQIILENVVLQNHSDIKLPQQKPDDLALMQYTSGTTGTPLGSMLSHQNILYNLELIKISFNHDESLVGVNWLPPFHDMGLIGTILQPLYAGGQNVIIHPNDFLRNPILWFDAIKKYRGTTVGCPNFALDLLVERISEEEKQNIDLSSVKVFFCGSEPIHPGSVKGFAHAFSSCGFNENAFLPCYGLAENTLMASGIHASQKVEFLQIDRRSLLTMGVVSPAHDNENSLGVVGCGNTWLEDEIRIVETESKLPMPEGQVGEIWIRSKSTCSGYYNNPQKTDELFSYLNEVNGGRPYLRTGDLGFIFNDQLYVTGRIKEVMKIRGKSHYPQDIENTVENVHPALQSNACAAFHFVSGHREELVILQEVKRTAIRTLDAKEVVETIRRTVAEEHDIPVFAIELISPGRLPRTSSGKIQRIKGRSMWLEKSLKTIYSWQYIQASGQAENYLSEESGIPDAERLQTWLIHWLSQKLGISPDTIDPEDPILSYGLDSMGAVELEREVNEKFGIEIHLADFLENNSIKALADMGVTSLANGKKQ